MSLEIKDDFINPENLYNDKDEDKKKENITKYKKSIAQDLNSLNVEMYVFKETWTFWNKSLRSILGYKYSNFC